MSILKIKKPENILKHFLLALGLGLLLGMNRGLGPLLGFVAVGVGMGCVYFSFNNNVSKVFTLLPYLLYSEIYLRAFVRTVPYLFIPYILITVFGVLFLNQSGNSKFHSRGFFLLVLFTIIEASDVYRSNDADTTRFYVISSIELMTVVMYASFTSLTPAIINLIFKNIKIASIFLVGIVFAAHVTGHINYGSGSNVESTNGLAPVQISGYLGLSCILFFLSVMDTTERKEMVINIFFLTLSVIMMLLSFSRGGLYFVGIIVGLYYLFNRSKKSSYFSFLILVPLSAFVYWFVTDATEGAIETRYAEVGSSGRDVLVEIGFKLFNSNPLVGVGTGNFNSEILKQKLYSQESGAHNEFVRVAAEHGILGIITYWGFYLIIFFEIFTRKKTQREYSIYFITFFCLVIVHNGLKIGIQPMIMLLALGVPANQLIKRKKTFNNVSINKELTT